MPSQAFLNQQFKPGQSGNPNGRPRKRPLSEAYDDLLREPLPERERKALGLKPGVTWAEAIAASRARHALTRGGTESARELREAVEGKATQRIELARGEDRGPEFIVSYATPIPGVKMAVENDPQIIDMKPEQPSVKALGAGEATAGHCKPSEP